MGAILLPLLAALIFPASALASRRAMDLQGSTWVTALASGLALGLGSLAALPWLPPAGDGARPWQPLAAGALFFTAQALTYLSFNLGDLSLAVPAQGAKVPVVAGLTVACLGQSLSWRIWLAAGLACAALILLREDRGGARRRRRTFLTLALALGAAAAFAGFDVSVQAWSRSWGAYRFLALAFGAQAVLSLAWWPWAWRPALRSPRRAWGWLALGAAVTALVSVAVTAAIGLGGAAAVVNILYSSRVVWGVLAVWLAGRWFGNREAKRGGRKVMGARLAGSAAMLGAVALALI